jgi:hypothetical protein
LDSYSYKSVDHTQQIHHDVSGKTMSYNSSSSPSRSTPPPPTSSAILPENSSTNYDPFFSTFDQNSFASHFNPTGVPYQFYSDAASSYFSSQARNYSDYLSQQTDPPTNTNNSATAPIANSWYQPPHCTDPRFTSKKGF